MPGYLTCPVISINWIGRFSDASLFNLEISGARISLREAEFAGLLLNAFVVNRLFSWSCKKSASLMPELLLAPAFKSSCAV
jgi:hypothetical protein